MTSVNPSTLIASKPASRPAPAFAPGFWQRQWVQRIVPFATSLSFHLALLLLALILLPPLVKRAVTQASKEEIIVPDATLASDGHPGGIPNPGLGGDPSRPASQENDPTVVDSHGWAQRHSESLSQTLKSSAMDPDRIAGEGRFAAGLTWAGALGGGEGELAAFGPRGGGGGAGPKSKIFGHGGNVYKIIYVCDGSGSMIGVKDIVLRQELQRDVGNLAPIQAFNVIFFTQTEGAFHAIAPQMLMASPRNKTRVFDYLRDTGVFDHSPDPGDTNPIAALEEAFREKPQLIFLLTDGDFQDPPGSVVMAKINDLNRDKKVHINTILLLGSKDEKDTNKDFEVIMSRIAADNGGIYRKFYCDDSTSGSPGGQ